MRVVLLAARIIHVFGEGATLQAGPSVAAGLRTLAGMWVRFEQTAGL